MKTERNKLDPRTQALFERIEAIRQPAPTPEACSGDARALRAVIDTMGTTPAYRSTCRPAGRARLSLRPVAPSGHPVVVGPGLRGADRPPHRGGATPARAGRRAGADRSHDTRSNTLIEGVRGLSGISDNPLYRKFRKVTAR